MSKQFLKTLEKEKKSKVETPPSLWGTGGILCGRLDVVKSKLSSSFGDVLLTDEEKADALKEDRIEQQLYEAVSKQAVLEMKMRKNKLQELKTAKKEIESYLSKNNDQLSSHKNLLKITRDKYSSDKHELNRKTAKNIAEKNYKLKEMKMLEPEISTLEEKLSTMMAKYKLLEGEAEKLDIGREKINEKTKSLDKNFERDNLNLENQTKSYINEIEQLTMKLKKNEKETEDLINLDSNVKPESTKEMKPDQGENLFLEHLTEQIRKLEGELACPVCFETAQSPIYMCRESHLICQECRPRIKKCPECRVAYQAEKKVHRYAQKQLDELLKLREKKKDILDRNQINSESDVKVDEPEENEDEEVHKLSIGNIPDEVTDDDLELVFKRYGTVRKVEISKQCHRFGHVEFNTKEGLENALKNRNNIAVRTKDNGGLWRRLRVKQTQSST